MAKPGGSYPGMDSRMSLYGCSELDPRQVTGLWKECIKKQEWLCQKHLANKGDGSKMFPGVPPINGTFTQPQNYFQVTKEHKKSSSYDAMFATDYGYNGKLHRDDRRHSVGLDIHSEECKRTVPVRSSSEYGRRVVRPLDGAAREHVRINHVTKGFYRSRGTGIPTSNDV